MNYSNLTKIRGKALIFVVDSLIINHCDRTGSIGLATNAGNYFFLHDLAQRYTKKMEIYMEANPIFAFEKKPSQTNVASSGSSETAESTEVTHLLSV